MSIINKLKTRSDNEISEKSKENINIVLAGSIIDVGYTPGLSFGYWPLSSVGYVALSSILKLNWLRPTVFDYLIKVDNNYDINVAYGDIEDGEICTLLKSIISKEKEIFEREECFFSVETRNFEMSNFSFRKDGIKLIEDIVDFCANIAIKNFSRVDPNTIKNFISEILKISISKTNEEMRNNQTFVIFKEKTTQCGVLHLDVEYKQDSKGLWLCETQNVSAKITKKYAVFHDTKDLLASLRRLCINN